jgi:hypothetical protein
VDDCSVPLRVEKNAEVRMDGQSEVNVGDGQMVGEGRDFISGGQLVLI